MVFNPLQYTKAAKPVPGKVDFKAIDNLDIPECGKRNMLLNPYFGQRYNYCNADVSKYYPSLADLIHFSE